MTNRDIMNPEDMRGMSIEKKAPTLVVIEVLRCSKCGTDFHTPTKDVACPYCFRHGTFKKLSEFEEVHG